MDIRSAIVDGTRVFSTSDICKILGIQPQTIRYAADSDQAAYFGGDSGSIGGARLVGFPFCEIKEVLERRMKRDRIGSNIAPSILEWMSTQSHLEKVETVAIVPAVPNFRQMTSEEIYDAGLMDEFLEFATKEKAEKEKRNEALKAIKDAKDLLESLN